MAHLQPLLNCLILGAQPINESYWHPAASQNDSNNKDCAVSEIKPSGFWWRPVNCEEKHGFICKLGNLMTFLVYL